MECHSVPWYREPACLLRNWKEFFPARGMSPADTLNALTRFVMYSCTLIALYQNDFTPVAIGVMVIVLITAVYVPYMHTHRPTPTHAHRQRAEAMCTAPTSNNPFMNVLPHEYTSDKPKACPSTPAQDREVNDKFEETVVREISDVYKKRASDRQFITMPVTSSIPDTQAFSNFLFSETVKGTKCK